MAQEIAFHKIFPIYKVEHDCILSKQGDVTLAFEATLPEIFTLSDQEYEAFHQVLVKAIKVLPNQTVFHKQDWFFSTQYKASFERQLEAGDAQPQSFLTRSSERFFNERPYLDHTCYIMLTRKPANRKPSSSVFSNLIRRSMVPEGPLNPQRMQEFLDGAGQFERILKDSGFVKLRRLTDDDIVGAPLSGAILSLVDGGIRAIRRVMNDLRPALLDDLGLAAAVRALAHDVGERGHLAMTVDIPAGLPRLSSEAELALFRAAQEALANVVRHAEASTVTIRLRADDHTLRLTVRDNGRGLPSGADVATFERQGHLGLAGMRERIQALGGRVRFAGEQGMTVIVDVPVEPGRTAQ